MKKYKVTIEYDGSKYKGWQRLNNTDKTIQEKIEVLLTKTLGKKIEIHGSGRTDTGVHAFGQVAHFEINDNLDTGKLLATCNQMLPQDIVFTSIKEVDDFFHARYSVKGKRYVYKIWNNEIPSALNRKYTLHIPNKLNIDAMKKGAEYLIGEHDFSSFTADKAKGKSKNREIFSIKIIENGSDIEIEYFGEGFLYKMVRIITGTLIEVGLGEKIPEDIKMILEQRDRGFAGHTAPSHGLYLLEVIY